MFLLWACHKLIPYVGVSACSGSSSSRRQTKRGNARRLLSFHHSSAKKRTSSLHSPSSLKLSIFALFLRFVCAPMHTHTHTHMHKHTHLHTAKYATTTRDFNRLWTSVLPILFTHHMSVCACMCVRGSEHVYVYTSVSARVCVLCTCVCALVYFWESARILEKKTFLVAFEDTRWGQHSD